MGKRTRRRCRLLAKGDLIQKILLRLPVKSLLRFKSVCKSWFALIESSSFIDLHTTTTTTFNSSNKFGSFIFHTSVHLPRLPDKPYTPRVENSLVMVSPESKSKLVLQLDSLGVLPYYHNVCFFKYVLGSCNGLACLYNSTANRVCLWNPATKKHRILPEPIELGVYLPKRLVAFGFDVQTKDYKVILLTGFPSQNYRPIAPVERVCRFQVYNLSTDSWRVVEGITCLPGDPFRYPCETLYLNGSIFFMAHFFRTKHHQPCIPESNRFVFSFDLTKEIITPIQLPDHHRDQELYLSYLGDKLALFTVVRTYDTEIYGYEDYDIWVLNEHGNNNSSSSSSVNKDSWTKLHSFQITVERPGEMNIPRGISNDGKFAFLELDDSTGFRKMKMYHFISKEVKQTFPSCGSMMFRANAYKPSLVSITGGGNGAAIEEEILDETDEYINIHNRIKVNMQASQGKVPNLNSPEPIGYLNQQHSPVTPHLVAPGPTPTLSVSTGTSAS